MSSFIDIWSLGCIFLEVLVWMHEGIRGLEQFRNERLVETKKKTNFEDLQAFHDSRNVRAKPQLPELCSVQLTITYRFLTVFKVESTISRVRIMIS